MNKALLALACILLAILSANAQTRTAVSVLTPTTAGPAGSTGVLEIVEMNNMTRVVGTFNGLPPNTVHQVHIHTWGNIASADGSATGDHYNPTMMNHTSHVGDLGNVTVNAQGVGTINITNNEVKLSGQFSVIGRAAVLQLGTSEDGTRLLQGVIGIDGNTTATNTNGRYASAELKGVNGNDMITGRVNYEQLGGGMVMLNAAICGLAPNASHGFHVHYYGDLRNNGTFGGHFNPNMQLHGYPFRVDRHVGDMGNITADANGRATLTGMFNLLTLNETNSIIGRGVVLHLNADNGGQPTGNAGPYAAIGVIGIVNPLTAVPATCAPAPTNAPTTAAPTTAAPTTAAPTTAPGVSGASVKSLSAVAVIVILALLF